MLSGNLWDMVGGRGLGSGLRGVILALALLAIVGCNPKNKVTEEDRQGIDVALQIDRAEDAELDRLEIALSEAPELKAKFWPVVERMRVANDDRAQIHTRLLENFGPPGTPVVYSHETIGDLLERMRKAHAVTFWGTLGAIVLSVGAATLGIARKFGKYIPGFGPIFAIADTTIEAIETFMQKNKEGKPDIVAELRDTLQKAHEDANLRPYVDKLLAKAQDRLGIPVGEILPATAPAAAPASTATPPSPSP